MARKKRDQICGVYKIENLINGKAYIGQSRDIIGRWNRHISSMKTGTQVLYNAMRKYGVENFNFEILIECEEDLLDLMEIYYIKKYNTYIHSENSNGYNMTTGGDFIKGRSINTKRVCCDDKIFDSVQDCMDYLKTDINHSCFITYLNGTCGMPKELYDRGLRYIDKQMSDYRIKKSFSENCIENFSKPTMCDDIEFKSAKDVADYLNMPINRITSYLNHHRNMPKELYDRGLRYKDEPKESYIISEWHNKGVKHNNSKCVVCDNMFFECIARCAEYYNERRNNMSRWLSGYCGMPKKYKDLNLHYATKEEIENENIKLEKHNTKIEVFKDGKSMGVFKSATELEKCSIELFKVKFIQSSISRVAIGKRKHHKGYTFKYID